MEYDRGEVAGEFAVAGEDGGTVLVNPEGATFELGDEEPVLSLDNDEYLPGAVRQRVHEVTEE